MKIKIITDSGSDMAFDNEKDVQVIPLTVRFGEDEFKDGLTISNAEFYDRMAKEKELPKTSQITPYIFEAEISKALETYDAVIIITIGSALSGTFQSAVTASMEFEGKVFCVDSKTVSVGVNLLIEEGVRLIEKGLEAKEIADSLNKLADRVRTLAMLDTLDNLKKGGRISPTVAFAGGLLSIKPIVTVDDGSVNLIATARGSKKANSVLMEKIEAYGGINLDYPVVLGYTGVSDVLIRRFMSEARSLLPVNESTLPILHIGAAIGTHVGAGATAIAFVENK